MGKQTIGIGAVANDGTGDDLRTAGDKINDNFDELYGLVGGFSLTASEDIAAGDFVNIHASTGAKVRKTDANVPARFCSGYAPAAILSTASGTILGPGVVISGLSGLTPGATYYLSGTAGAITATAPSSSGDIVQEVGIALSATQLLFNPKASIEL